MSVFGGDSWAREAQNRKRRAEDLVTGGLDGSSYKKLSNGKFACLVCPNNPVLDSPLMLSMHSKGARHRAAESKCKERELIKRDEINKRIALSSTGSTSRNGIPTKPLIEQTRKATSEILENGACTSGSSKGHDTKSVVMSPSGIASRSSEGNNSLPVGVTADKGVSQQHLDFRERRERELKFTSAGWKRDANGRWFKDENAEFDSDEEDPNVCLV